MANHEQASIDQEPEDYRGGLVYTQEYGYKLVTMTISIAPGEQSHVTSHAHDLPISEDAEHLPEVDLYHFSVTDGTRIQLTIDTPTGCKEAWYTVHPDGIVAERSPIEMDIVRSSDSLPFDDAHSQEALDDALTYYADQLPHWLGEHETPRNTPTYDHSDFGR